MTHERFGSDLNWHARFHLLAHAGPGAILLAFYLWAYGDGPRHVQDTSRLSKLTRYLTTLDLVAR